MQNEDRGWEYIKAVLFKGNLPVAGWLPTDPPGHSRYNLISLLTWKNINLLNLTKIHLPKHPSPVSLSHLEPCFSSSPSCWSRVCHQRRGGSGWLSTGWQEERFFWSILWFSKKDYSYQSFYQYSTFLSFSTRSKRSSTRQNEASQNLLTRNWEYFTPSRTFTKTFLKICTLRCNHCFPDACFIGWPFLNFFISSRWVNMDLVLSYKNWENTDYN